MFTRFALGAVIGVLIVPSALGNGDVLVAAASSIREPLNAIISRFTRETNVAVRVSYGASGNLTHQILRGAPYDIFLSADEEFPRRLAAAGKVVKEPEVYALGRLVLYAPATSALDVTQGLRGIRESVAREELNRIAVAHPQLAPYGRAAREVLQGAGLWSALENRVVIGNNVAQVAQFAVSGSVDAALISLSLAILPELAGKGRFEIIPEALHTPVRHAMVLLNAADRDVSRFFEYLSHRSSREEFRQRGFHMPEAGD